MFVVGSDKGHIQAWPRGCH